MLEDEEELREKLAELRVEHRDLDVIIEQLQGSQPVDFLRLQRLKKRKLAVKDMIAKIESLLVPDIIA